MRAFITMMSYEHFEALIKGLIIHIIRPQRKEQLRLGRSHDFDAAFHRIAEHQPSNAPGGEVKNVKAVPAFFYKPGCLRESQCRSMNTGHGQCAAAQAHCMTLGLFESIVQRSETRSVGKA